MIPEIDTKIATVIRALETIIKPSLGDSNALAQEQVGLCIKTLEMVHDQFPYYDRYMRADIADNLALGAALIDHATQAGDEGIADLDGVVTNIKKQLQLPGIGVIELRAMSRSLREAIATWVDLRNACSLDVEVARLVLRHSQTMTARGRSWNQAMGFEGDNTMPSFQSLLGD